MDARRPSYAERPATAEARASTWEERDGGWKFGVERSARRRASRSTAPGRAQASHLRHRLRSKPQAQEDNGGGFVIGFGGGYGSTNWKDAAYYLPGNYIPTSHSGFTANFRIGAAINKRILILFHSTNTFFSTDTEGTVADGMAGGDLQMHFGRKGRSFYVFGGAGYQNIMHFSVDDPYAGSNSFGLGIRGGAGFEIVKYRDNRRPRPARLQRDRAQPDVLRRDHQLPQALTAFKDG